MPYHIRPFTARDAAFITQLVARFSDFDLPPWREKTDVDRTNNRALQQAMENQEEGSVILVAEEDEAGPVGFIHLQTETDYFSGKQQGYISDVAVSRGHEGKGIGRMLMLAAENWAQEMGYEILTLYVFAGNIRARQMYERLGFQPDLLKYAKPIQHPDTGNDQEK
ncbi:MAG: GNAT family N-acetyltransferase [Anaerolineae bacterium]|nr:GNAT family N-acetyltransferase [Anaerolineae bacterium]